MRAYLVTVRTDLDNAQLLIYNLRPDTMHRVPSMEPAGQTRYIPRIVRDDVLQLNTLGDGSATLVSGAAGIAAWALDNIQNQDKGLSLALTSAQAADFAQKVRLRADAGAPLQIADLNAVLNTVAGVTASYVGGDPSSKSTGTVADLLQLLSGSIYEVAAGAQVVQMNGAFPLDASGNHVPAGGFRPDLPQNPPSFVGTWKFPEKTLQPGHPAPPHFPTRNAVPLVDTGELRLSVRAGELAKLVSPAYFWRNPLMTYGYGGTAQTLGGQPIPGVNDPNPYQARAVVVYDAVGVPIV